MKVKFTKSLTLIDGEGVLHIFEAGKTYSMADYWAKQVINSGEAIEVKPLEVSI